jgi:polyisoprenoid-binding protein YceI
MTFSSQLGVAVFCAALALGSTLASADAWTIDPGKSPVGFVAVGKPGFLKIKGEGAQLVGSATLDAGKLSGTFTVALARLTTGIDLRDEHMKEKYLEVAKFPDAALTIDPLSVNAGSGEYSFTGKLTIKGNSKPVAGLLELDLQSERASGTAEFTVKISDYPEIGVPSHLGVTVAESVDVRLEFAATKAADVAKK